MNLCTSHLKPPHTPILALAGTFTSDTLHSSSLVNWEFAWSIDETTSKIKIFWNTHWALRSFCKLFAGRSRINLFISWLPTFSFYHCVPLGNKLFYKGSTMCSTKGAGELPSRSHVLEHKGLMTSWCFPKCRAHFWFMRSTFILNKWFKFSWIEKIPCTAWKINIQ